MSISRQYRILVLGLSSSIPTVLLAAPFQNGSFEVSSVTTDFVRVLSAGDTSLTGWTVVGHSVEHIKGYWQPSEGQYSLDLSGNLAGGVAQTFDTLAGQAYQVTFDLSGNPDFGGGIRKGKVSAAGQEMAFSFDTTGWGHGNMNWTTTIFTFTANSALTTLTFESTETSGGTGPALDHVRVQAVPEPATMALLGLGVSLVARRRRK